MKRDSDCNGNEKDNSEKQLGEGKLYKKKKKKKELKKRVIYRESWGKGEIKLSLRKR